MTDLRGWIARNALMPVSAAVAGAAFLQLSYFWSLASHEYSAELSTINRAVSSSSLGLQQDNRPLIEAVLAGAVQSEKISMVALCHEGAAEIQYPPILRDPCSSRPEAHGRWTLRKPAIGLEGYDFLFQLRPWLIFGPALALGGITLTFALAMLLILNRARGRFENEVLQPLYGRLEAEEPLEIKEMEDVRRRLQETAALKRRQAVSEALFALSTQVAHDIRSPLAALDSVMKDASRLPEAQRSIVRSAAAQIRDIADNLLEKNRSKAIQAERLGDLTGAVVAEKRLQHQSRTEVSIEAELDASSENLFAKVDATDFKRVLSNLINNAVEAIPGKGRVVVRVSRSGDDALIEIEDDGKGIPPELLARLGERGATHGKAEGSGLGLHHAKKTVESWGGVLELNSRQGHGTTASIRFPEAPLAPRTSSAVLIDDDMLVHKVWTLAAKEAGLALSTYSNPAQFLKAVASHAKGTPIYVDSDLGDGIKGQDFAKDLSEQGFTELFLATGHAPESFPPMPWIKAVVGKEPPWG